MRFDSVMFDGCPRNVPFFRLLQLHNILLRALHHSSLSRANSAKKSFSLLHTRLPNATRNVKRKEKNFESGSFSILLVSTRLDSTQDSTRFDLEDVADIFALQTHREVFLSSFSFNYCVQVGFSFIPFFRTNTHTHTHIDMHVWLNSFRNDLRVFISTKFAVQENF